VEKMSSRYIISQMQHGERRLRRLSLLLQFKMNRLTKGKKGQSKRDKVDGNSKGGTVMEAANDT
jgi:hypothetical protein